MGQFITIDITGSAALS